MVVSTLDVSINNEVSIFSQSADDGDSTVRVSG